MSVSFAKGLFLGQVQPDLITPFPTVSEEERETARMLLDSYQEFAAEQIDGGRFDQEHAVPASVREGLGELGLLGLTIPEEHGGAGLTYTTYCRMMEETNRHCGSVAVVLGGHQSIGIKALLLFGTDEQKERWLPKLATGEWMAAYALTEPQAGSDPAALETMAVPSEDGSSYTLTGQKIWITNGGFADFMTVFAKTPTESGKQAISCFVVTPDEMASGFSRGAEEDKLGLRGSSTTQLFFDGMKVPAENLLGPPGKGLKVALTVLNYGRASLAAGCAGSSKTILAAAAKHCSERVQFGRPIAEFEMIQSKLAEMMSLTYAMETISYLTVGMADRGDADFAVEAAICKVFATEAHWVNCNHAVQVAGGIAYVSEYPYERFLRDARINMIFEGTNEILHHFIALTALRPVAENVGVEGAAFPPVHAAVDGEVARLTELATRLGDEARRVVADDSRPLPDREHDQERVAAAGIQLYVGFAVAARLRASLAEKGEDGIGEELDIATKALRDARRAAEAVLSEEARADDELIGRVSRAATAHDDWPLGLFP
ncbi:MAG: acyl-CoA dehydrogenase family protein [Acidobacteriota bacterium]